MSEEERNKAEEAARREAMRVRLVQRRAELAAHQQISKAIEWVEERWGASRSCPYCDHDQWEISTPVEIPLRSGEAMSPAIPVMCSNCGHTVFINAIRAGLYPDPEK
jgi:RNase P subunit RPR2